MPLLSPEELKTLIEESQGPCVSIYMPMQKAGPDVRQNPIRFKNLIREAEERLDALEIRHTEAVDFLKPAHELDNSDFWENQDHGLAIFIAPELFRYYSLPSEFEELVAVSDRFHIKPLLPLLNNDGRFYVLALSQKDVRFFEGTRSSVKEIELEVPKSMDEALQNDDTGRQIQNRIATSKGGTANAAVQPGSFHGQGSPETDDTNQYLLQFFHAVDGGLHEKLRNKKSPLVLAGVEYLFPIYREANHYQHLVEEGITGNPEILKPEELHERAWPIVEPLFHQAERSAMELYQELAGSDTGKANSDIKEVISAAYYQRVDTLFVATGQQYWGRFDPEAMTVHLHSEPEPNDEDMLDFAAIHTLLNGGTVYAMPLENMPDRTPVAAIFRY